MDHQQCTPVHHAWNQKTCTTCSSQTSTQWQNVDTHNDWEEEGMIYSNMLTSNMFSMLRISTLTMSGKAVFRG